MNQLAAANQYVAAAVAVAAQCIYGWKPRGNIFHAIGYRNRYQPISKRIEIDQILLLVFCQFVIDYVTVYIE